MSLIIAFGHKAKTGKDAAVKAIIEGRGDQYDIRRYAFADALKQEVTEEARKHEGIPQLIAFLQNQEEIRHSAPDGYSADPDLMSLDPHEPLEDDPLCEFGKHRGLLQYWGQMRRRENPFYWVDKIDRKILDEKPTVALISDMRYMNEALMVRHYKGYTVRMERVNRKALSATHEKHPSETQLDKWVYDFQIVSEKDDLEVLKKDALEIFDIIAEAVDVHSAEEFTFTTTEVLGGLAGVQPV